MDADKKNKTSLDGDADVSALEMSVLEVSTSQDDTLNYQTADEENNSKYFSVIEGDSTLEGSSSADVTLDSKSDLNISSVAEKGPFGDGNDKKPSQVLSSLSSLSIESVNKLQIHERIDAANILSGGVDIFDDNENSVDEHELVIDDDAHPSEKSNDCTENSGEVSRDTPYKCSTLGKISGNSETNFNKHFELFKKCEDVDVKSDSPSKCDTLVVVAKDSTDDKNGQGATPKEMGEESHEPDTKTDNYSALLQSNLPEGSSEVTLLIDDKNVDAIDIGEGVFIYKNDDGELTAIQITMNEDGTTNFKCLHVGKNEDGNLEVYEEQVNQVPVTNEELESMKAKELTKEVDTAEIMKSAEEVKTKEILVLDKTESLSQDTIECVTLKSQNDSIKACDSKDEVVDTNIAIDPSEDLVINIVSTVSSVDEVTCDDTDKCSGVSDNTIVEKLDNVGNSFALKTDDASSSKLSDVTDVVKNNNELLAEEETKVDSQTMVPSTEGENINRQVSNKMLTIDITDETKQPLEGESKNSGNSVDSTSPICSNYIIKPSDGKSICNEDTVFSSDEKIPLDIYSDINIVTSDEVIVSEVVDSQVDSCEIITLSDEKTHEANSAETLARIITTGDSSSRDVDNSPMNISSEVSEISVNEKNCNTENDKAILTSKLDIVPAIEVYPKSEQTSNKSDCSVTSEHSLVSEDDSLDACKISKLDASSQSIPTKINDDNVNLLKSSETDSTSGILQESEFNNVNIPNEDSSELKVEEIIVVSDVTKEDISELGVEVVTTAPDAAVEDSSELEVECIKSPGNSNEDSSELNEEKISVASDITEVDVSESRDAFTPSKISNKDSSESRKEVTKVASDITNENSSESSVEAVTVISDIINEDSSESRLDIVTAAPNITNEDSSESNVQVVTLVSDIINEDSSESRLDILTVAPNITHEDNSESRVDVTLVSDIINEDSSESRLDIVTVAPNITNEDSSESRVDVPLVSDIVNEDSSESRIDVVTIAPNITNEDSSESRIDVVTIAPDILNEGSSESRIDVTVPSDITHEEDSESRIDVVTVPSDIIYDENSEPRINVETKAPNITNEDNSELRAEHETMQSEIINENSSGLSVEYNTFSYNECQETDTIKESEANVQEELKITDERVNVHIEELNVVTEISDDCEITESSIYEEISIMQSDVSPESVESSAVKESEKLSQTIIDTQNHTEPPQGEHFKTCENLLESEGKIDTGKSEENVIRNHNIISRVFNQKNILNANNDTEIVQSLSEIAIKTHEENLQITSVSSVTEISTNSSLQLLDNSIEVPEKIKETVNEFPSSVKQSSSLDPVNHPDAQNDLASEKDCDNTDKILKTNEHKVDNLHEFQSTHLEDNTNTIDAILETCNSPSKTLASQSSAESEDELEEDDYVEGEPVTGDSGVEWNAGNIANPGIVDTLGKNNSNADITCSITEELKLGDDSGVSNASKDINDDVSDKNCIEDDNTTNEKIAVSCLEKQDLSDNNNDISAEGLSSKQTSKVKNVEGKESGSAVTEVDFDKFVRRNSVPLFEECSTVDFEDVAETVKTMSVPVVEKELEAEVVNKPLKELPLKALSGNSVQIISDIIVQPFESELTAKKTSLCESTRNKPKLNQSSASPASGKIIDNKNVHLISSYPASTLTDLKQAETRKSPKLYKSDCVKMLTKHPDSPSRPFANVSKLKTYSPSHKSIANMNSASIQKGEHKNTLNEDKCLSPKSPAATSHGCSQVSPTSSPKVSDANNIGKIVSECKGQPFGVSNEKTSLGISSSKLSSDAETVSSADESPTTERTPKAKSRQPRKQVFTPVTRSDMEIIFPNLYSNAEEYKKESEAKALKLNNKLKERDIRFKQLSKKDSPKSPVEKVLKNCNAVSVETTSDPVKAFSKDSNISPSPKIDNEKPTVVELSENGNIDNPEVVSATESVSNSPLSSSAKRKRGRPKKNQSVSSDILKSEEDSPSKRYLPDKIQDSPQRQESPIKEVTQSDDSPQANSISPFGKINDHIKCPICFKNFRTENVLLKHVKHCNGVIDIETIKSPRKRKITSNDSSKQDLNDESPESTESKKQITEIYSSKPANCPINTVETESKKPVSLDVDTININQKEVIESPLSVKEMPENEIKKLVKEMPGKNIDKMEIINCSETAQQPECESKIELLKNVTATPEKKAKIIKNDEANASLALGKSVDTTASKTLLETITIEDSSSSSPPSPSNLVLESSANCPEKLDTLIKKQEISKSPRKCDSEEIDTMEKSTKESSKSLKEKMFGGSRKQQTAMASPMTRLTKILNTKPAVNSPIVCEICGKTFRQLAHMVYHRTKHAADELVPSEDNTKVNPLKKLNVPEELGENSVETDAMLKCEICQKGFRKLHHLVEHRELHINNESRSRRTSVASVKSEPEAGFRCDTCDKSFRKLHHLVEHRELHIAEATESSPQSSADTKPVEDATCSGCGKSFRKRHHMVEHRDIHCSPSKKGKSDESAANDNNIRLSVASSTSEEGNNCGICGKSYRKLHHMVEHRESHAEVREEKNKNLPELLNTKDIIHECSRCYMVFPNENSLNKHVTICSRKKLLKSKSLQSENQEIINLSDEATVSQSMPSIPDSENVTEEIESVPLGGSDEKCLTSDSLAVSVSESIDTTAEVIALNVRDSEKPNSPKEITPQVDESKVVPSKDSTELSKRGRRSLFSKDNSVSKVQTPERKSVIAKDSAPLKSQESNVPKNASTVGVIKNLRKSLTARSQDSLKTQANKTNSPKVGSYSLRRSTTSVDSATSKVTSSRRSTNSIASADSKDHAPVKKLIPSKDKSASKLKIPLRKSLVSTVPANSKKVSSPKTVTNPAAAASTKKAVTKYSPKKTSQLGSKSKDDESTIKYMFNKNPEFKYKLNPVYNKPNRRLSQPIKPKATSGNVVKPRARTSESALSGLKLPTAKMLKTILEESTIRYSFPKSPDVKVKPSDKSDHSAPSTSQSTKKSIITKASTPLLKVNEKIRKNKKVISSLLVSHKKKSIGGRNSVDGKKLPGIIKKLQLRCCGQVFGSQANLSIHRKTHKAVRQIHKCDCGKAFDSEGMLKRHIDTEHTPPKSYQCSECGTSVRTAAQFAKHKRDHETKTGKPGTSQQSTTVPKTSVVKKDQNKAGKATTTTSKQQSDPAKHTLASKKTPGKLKSPPVAVKKGVKRKIAHGGVPLSEKMKKAIAGVKF